MVARWEDALVDELLELAVRVARAAARELLYRYGGELDVVLKSSATDPVSDADKASEQLLRRMIGEARPDDGMLGEEGTDESGTSGLTWVFDPLDGTVNYLYQLDNFSVSVAVDDADGALVGVVLDPVRDTLFTAVRGRGAWRNGHRLRVAAAVPAAHALLGTGFGYDPARRARQGALIARVLPQVRDIRRIGSAALDLCMVASGSLNAYYEEGVNRWDVAAGGLVAAEAGAVVSTFRPLGVPTGALAAAPALHEELSGLLSEAAKGLDPAGE